MHVLVCVSVIYLDAMSVLVCYMIYLDGCFSVRLMFIFIRFV